MKKIITFFSLLLLAVSIAVSDVRAQNPCDPCPLVPWNAPLTTTFTFSIPSKPGCLYKAYVKYRTRTCNGMTQIEVMPRPVFEDLNGGNPGCAINCINGGELHKIVYNQILNLIGGGATVISVEESPCYYTGTITVPPGAEVCFGMTPGTTKWVYMPCDVSGCCYSQLTPFGTFTYYKNVIQSTPCPTTPYTPVSTEIEWACDIVGGGVARFVVPFTPDMPIVCQQTCYTGFAKPGKEATAIQATLNKSFSNLHIFPNPVLDELHVNFTAEGGKNITIQLIDIAGKLIAEKQLVSAGGNQEVVLDTKALPSGSYGLKVTYPDGQVMTKIVK